MCACRFMGGRGTAIQTPGVSLRHSNHRIHRSHVGQREVRVSKVSIQQVHAPPRLSEIRGIQGDEARHRTKDTRRKTQDRETGDRRPPGSLSPTGRQGFGAAPFTGAPRSINTVALYGVQKLCFWPQASLAAPTSLRPVFLNGREPGSSAFAHRCTPNSAPKADLDGDRDRSEIAQETGKRGSWGAGYSKPATWRRPPAAPAQTHTPSRGRSECTPAWKEPAPVSCASGRYIASGGGTPRCTPAPKRTARWRLS